MMPVASKSPEGKGRINGTTPSYGDDRKGFPDKTNGCRGIAAIDDGGKGLQQNKRCKCQENQETVSWESYLGAKTFGKKDEGNYWDGSRKRK